MGFVVYNNLGARRVRSGGGGGRSAFSMQQPVSTYQSVKLITHNRARFLEKLGFKVNWKYVVKTRDGSSN